MGDIMIEVRGQVLQFPVREKELPEIERFGNQFAVTRHPLLRKLREGRIKIYAVAGKPERGLRVEMDFRQ